MSHEIRTPISGIIGLSEHLQTCTLNREPRDLAKDIHETARFLLHLVNDILDLSKLDSGKMAIESIPFSLNQVIRDTLVPLQFQADEKKIALEWGCDIGTKDLLLGDPSRIRQILTNLLGNSLKFTKQGRVRLRVNGVPKADTATIKVHFVVQDTGIGISEEAIGKLFNPFSQADTSTARIYGGTGLGLTICRDLTRLMGGEISLKSTPGQGTTVTCSVPFTRQTSSKDARHFSRTFSTDSATGENNVEHVPFQSEGNLSQGVRERQESIPGAPTTIAPKRLIFIVDDNPINRKVNSLYMTKFGYDVAVACDGQEACDYLNKSSGNPRPDLVFMDCMMPVVDGYEATHRIRTDAEAFDEKTRALPIIALTASALQSDRDRCWEAGMNDCIGRPVRGAELKAAIDRWFASGA
jgi:CheY-like chemotaxis protein